MRRNYKVIGLASLAAVLAVGVLGSSIIAAEEGAASAAAALDSGSLEMQAAVSDLGKGDLEGASASSAKAFESLSQEKGGSGAVPVDGAGWKPNSHNGGDASCAASAEGECFAGLGRYLKGAAVGGSVGGVIGTVSGLGAGYLGASSAIDYIQQLAAYFGIEAGGSKAAGLALGMGLGGVVGAAMGAVGGAVTGAAILGYSPLRNMLEKAVGFFKNLTSSKRDG